MPRLSDEKYQKIIDDYLSGLSQKETGDKNGIKDESVGDILRRFGVPVREYTGLRSDGMRKWLWDFDFFSRYDDPVVAYWAGFMMADGNITKTGKNKNSGCLTVFIRDYDEPHLLQFLSDIKLSSDAIYRYIMGAAKTPHVGVKLNRPQLVADLVPWGIVPNKTYSYIEPVVSPEMLPHYLRGWVDGDGSLHWGVEVVGSPLSMVWFDQALKSLGFSGEGVWQHHEKYSKVKYYVKYVEEIANLLGVKENYCMRRKWGRRVSLPE